MKTIVMGLGIFIVALSVTVGAIYILHRSLGPKVTVKAEPKNIVAKDPRRYFMVGYRLVNESERYSMGNYFLWVDSPTYSGIRKMIYNDAKGDVPGAKIEDCVLLGMYEFPDSASYFQFQRK